MNALGIIIILASIGCLALLVFFVVPKWSLRYKFYPSVKEGVLNSDFSCYVAEQQNAHYIDSYSLVNDRKRSQRYIKVNYAKDIHNLSFYVVLFDIHHKPIGMKFINVADAEFEQSKLIPVSPNVFGLYLQVTAAGEDKFDDTLPVYLTESEFVITAIINAILAGIAAIGVSLGWALLIAGIYFSSAFPYRLFILLIVSVVTMIVTFFVSYFLLRIFNKKYLREEKSV